MQKYYIGYKATGGIEIVDGPRMQESKSGKSKSTQWKVKCLKCNNIFWVWSSSIERRNRKFPCKRCYDSSMRRTDSWPALQKAYLSAKGGAKTRELEWSISMQDYLEIASKSCYYCGSAPTEKKPAKSWQEPIFLHGLDRVNNKMGYKKENLVACCKQCNWAKKDLSQKEFIGWVTSVYNNANRPRKHGNLA